MARHLLLLKETVRDSRSQFGILLEATMFMIPSIVSAPLWAQLIANKNSKSASPPPPSPEPAPDEKKKAAFEAAKKLCRMGSPKAMTYLFCVDQAKERIYNPPPPSPPKTELEQELARCNMMGKPHQVWSCKQDAPQRLEARRKEAEEAAARESKLTPLQRALNRCTSYSKAIQIFQCRDEAYKKYVTNR